MSCDVLIMYNLENLDFAVLNMCQYILPTLLLVTSYELFSLSIKFIMQTQTTAISISMGYTENVNLNVLESN